MGSPSIACIGLIGKHNNPLHITVFPPQTRSLLDFSLLLNSSLDIYEARMASKTVDQDFGMLKPIDQRLTMYGWLTTTGVKIVAIVDMEGKPTASDNVKKTSLPLEVKDSDLKPLFRALQTAYVQLLQNPFYNPDEHNPPSAGGIQKAGSTQITSRKFIREVQRVGETWAPGRSII